MMRIVGGSFRGRTLVGPKDQAIRPTSDRLRESLFNMLEHGHGDPCEGARVLDLFAGTGALGLEALSRGAKLAALVDKSAEARGLMRSNIEALGVGGIARILRRDATRLGQIATFEPFTLLFADPPYRKALGEAAIASAIEGGWLADGALVVLEEAAEVTPSLPARLELIETRKMGDSQLIFARLKPG